MKKVIACVYITLSIVNAKPYLGGQVGISLLNNAILVKGNDYINNKAYPISKEFFFKTDALIVGIIGGYSFEKSSVFEPFIEVDYSYSGSKKTKSNLDYYEDAADSGNDLRNERISASLNHSVGFMLGINVSLTENLSGILGLRFVMNQVEIKGAHVTGTTGLIRSDNSKNEKAFVFGVEPTIGAKYDFTNNISGRITVGYHVGQKKRIVSNYISQPILTNDGVNASVSVKPRGVVIKTALIWNF